MLAALSLTLQYVTTRKGRPKCFTLARHHIQQATTTAHYPGFCTLEHLRTHSYMAKLPPHHLAVFNSWRSLHCQDDETLM
jgi:hypothetical protein